MATVLIPTALRGFSAGLGRVDVPGGGSLRQLIDQLEAACPGIKAQLLEDGDIRPGLAFFINDDLISEGLIERVPADATVLIQPAVGGGSLHDGGALGDRSSGALMSATEYHEIRLSFTLASRPSIADRARVAAHVSTDALPLSEVGDGDRGVRSSRRPHFP